MVYNLGSGHEVSVAEVVTAVRRITGRPVPANHLPPKPQPQVLMADSTRARADLGWWPQHSSLEEIIHDGWSALSRSLPTISAR